MNFKETNLGDVKSQEDFKRFKLIFCSVWLLVGIVFAIVGYFTFKGYKEKELKCTYEVSGMVSDLIRKVSEDSDGNESVSYHPVFTYRVGDLTYIKEYSYGGSSSNYHIGEDVILLLDPNNYDEYLVKGDISPKLFSIIFGGLGSVMVLIGLLSAIFLKYKSQEEINEETDTFIKENTISRDEFERDNNDDGDSPFVK